MAYVSQSEYKAISGQEMSDSEYSRKSAYADAYIDSLTLGRVGRAVECGEELPQSVKLVYSLIVDEVDALTSNGERVSSFSNGEDNYTFELTEDSSSRIAKSACDLLPIEWVSHCVGRFHHHAC